MPLRCAEVISLSLDAQRDDIASVIAAAVPEAFVCTQLTCTSDVACEQEEFLYLTELREGMMVDAQILSRGIAHLVSKNKFATIELTLKPFMQGKHLHVGLHGFWTFEKVKFQGVLLGKDSYRQFYLIEPGEPFVQEKHLRSLDKIRDSFAQTGYFDGTVSSEFIRNYQTKSVMVLVTLNKGAHFTVGDVNFVLQAGPHITPEEHAFVRGKIRSRFIKRLHGTKYNKEVLDTQALLIKNYLARRGYLQASIALDERVDRQHKKVHLDFIFDVHQKKEFIIAGNRFFSTKVLLKKLLAFGRSAWLLPASVLAQELIKTYRDKGFWDIAIEPREQGSRAFFMISEGGRARITDVRIEGAEYRDSGILAKKFFAPFINHKHYDATLEKKALDALVDFYVREGFVAVRIASKDYVRTDSNGHTLVVTLEEGVRSFLTEVKVFGFDEFDHGGPLAEFHAQTQAVPFDVERVQTQRAWLQEQLHKRGYVRADIKPEFERGNGTVAVTWRIASGPKVTFGKTVVVGSSLFPYKCVARELCYKDGDIWDKKKLKESLLKLRALDVFEGIQLQPGPLDEKAMEQTVLLKLQRDDPYELRARVGFGLQQMGRQEFSFSGLTYKVGGAFLYKNPTNVGDLIGIEANVTRADRTASIRYGRPWFFNIPARTIYKAYSNKHQHPGLIETKKNLYEVTQQGFLVDVTRVYPFADCGINLGVEWMRTVMRDDDLPLQTMVADRLARAINFEPQLLDKHIPYFVFEPTALFDFLDNTLDPTRGSLTLLSLKGMFPIGKVDRRAYFLKLQLEQSLFIPLEPFILCLRVRLGHIFHQDFKNIMPTERYYLGGSHSIRSYDPDRCPPLGEFVDSKGCVQCVPQGGKSMANINIEVRVPVYKQLGVAFFQDIGALSTDRIIDVKKSDVLAGTGFGIRYKTPIGPLRFDIAWKWKTTHKHESRYAWFLTFGHAF